MFLAGEKIEGAKCISAQGSSVKASRVPPLTLRLREGTCYFQAEAHLLWGVLVFKVQANIFSASNIHSLL